MVPDKNHKYVEKETNKNYTSTRKVPIMIPRLSLLVKEYQDNGKPIPYHSASALLSHVHKTCQRAKITDVGNHEKVLHRSVSQKAYQTNKFRNGVDRKIIRQCTKFISG